MKTIAPTPALLLVLLVLGHLARTLAADGRIAVVADGNRRDPDDICGTPVSLAILVSQGLEERLVHYSHSCDLRADGGTAERRAAMQDSCDGTKREWGAFPNVSAFYDCVTQQRQATEDLTKAIERSSATNLLWIVEAGEPDVIYDAMKQASADKHQFVRIITHHPNNDIGKDHGLKDIINDFAGFTEEHVHRIKDQNRNLNRQLGAWSWARDHRDRRLNWLYERGFEAQESKWRYPAITGKFDPSDAGMVWYWANDFDQDCTVEKLRILFESYIDKTSSLTIATTSLPGGFVENTYSQDLSVVGAGNAPLAWSITDGRLPPGLALDASSGGISGTLTTEGLFQFTVEVRDRENEADRQILAIKIDGKIDRYYNEVGGLVIMEAENTQTPLDLWKKGSELADHTGTGYLEFDGNTFSNGPAKSPLAYDFKINKGGLYYLHMRCAKTIIKGRKDVANDCYVRIEGNVYAGPAPHEDHGDNAPLSALKNDTKYYGGVPNRWFFENGSDSASRGGNLDLGGEHNKRKALYGFKEGETYRLIVSGRSRHFRIDRLVLRHQDAQMAHANDITAPESPLITDAPNSESSRSR